VTIISFPAIPGITLLKQVAPVTIIFDYSTTTTTTWSVFNTIVIFCISTIPLL
jgi:hypothetical protein